MTPSIKGREGRSNYLTHWLLKVETLELNREGIDFCLLTACMERYCYQLASLLIFSFEFVFLLLKAIIFIECKLIPMCESIMLVSVILLGFTCQFIKLRSLMVVSTVPVLLQINVALEVSISKDCFVIFNICMSQITLF